MEVLIDEVDVSVTNHAHYGGEGRRLHACDLPIHPEDGIAMTLSDRDYARFDICLGRSQFDCPFACERNRCCYAGITPQPVKGAEENAKDQYETGERAT